MTKLHHNIIANLAGQVWTALLGVLFMPVYLRVMGGEAYGLVGVYISLQALWYTLDAGMATTLNRELARHDPAETSAQSARDTVRTLECLFLPLCVLTLMAAPIIGHMISAYWLKPVDMSQSEVSYVISILALAIALQWPSSFYAGGLAGLECQISQNVIQIVFSSLRWIAVIPLLVFTDSSIETFAWWQVFIAALQTAVARVIFFHKLPIPVQHARFQRSIAFSIRKFALGMLGIACVSFVLAQADRIVLARILPLDAFGHYFLVATAAGALSRVFTPFFSALYPRYSRLVAQGKIEDLTGLYHRSNRILALVVSTLAAIMVLYAEGILTLWTGDEFFAASNAQVFVLLVLGSALNGIMNLPYAIQLAYGQTRLSLLLNVFSIIWLVPMIWYLADRYGALGAACAWPLLNLTYVSLGIFLMHRKILRGEMMKWYVADIILPSIFSVAVVCFVGMVFPFLLQLMGNSIALPVIVLISLLSVGFLYFLWIKWSVNG
ncbi:lipopolysaccharide biosynthesis protein [Delftia sp. WSY_14]|uniref:lipopolysaccharide biosynthesis protein n=1 Tax=unclassified Delftia TaxID=2613839 RepID=UPI00370CBE68